MVKPVEWTFPGHAGQIAARTWTNPAATHTVLLCHGYGEHVGRYQHVADHLVAQGAEVHGLDHLGHGRSAGDPVLVPDFEQVVDDVQLLATSERVASTRPLVLLGHSMGGMIAARYAQRHGEELTALVLSGPVLGRWAAAEALVDLPEMPDVPIDPSTLSRDPAVGEAYVADPLVWHGPFKQPTVAALVAMLRTINEGGRLGSLPTWWGHGAADPLVPIEGTRGGIETIRGADLEEHIYPGARHEILNETNQEEVLADIDAFIERAIATG